MRWTRTVLLTRALGRGRRNRVVPTPRRWRQVGDDASHEDAWHRAGDGGKKARSPGRSRISGKTIAQGRPDDPGDTCGDYRVLPTNAHGPWVRRAPSLPCALCFMGAGNNSKARANMRRDRERMTRMKPTRSSWPDLIRASINPERAFSRKRSIVGSGPALTEQSGGSCCAKRCQRT